ncbi:sodium-dependent dicarboxylate transporter 2/3/5 [Flavimobilis soli]|uniref:Sodium-dependent dicarboxylate transporter SdcS n=1 Tax=Flavimobilis soli TaxID=442709 RepID=A0A2A9EEX3_9MICO|nr:DASS family sodium-coupled anion symporter [Flavimobilis soli]PFG36822.1 sodium-dependent dicarboxylate transporter 2/3/5 [Flavimobilis soli]
MTATAPDDTDGRRVRASLRRVVVIPPRGFRRMLDSIRCHLSRSRLGLALGPAFAVVVYTLMPDVVPPAGADVTSPRAAALTAAVVVLMGVWWMTEAVPLAVTALLPVVLFPALGGVDVSAVTAPYASKVVFLFLGGFVLAAAMQRWRLHLRVALMVIKVFGTRPSRLVLGFMVATALLSMWVSNTATAVMMIPIGASVLTMLDRARGYADARLSASLMLGIAYAATIGSFGTIIGSPPNALLVGYLEQTHGVTISFAQWMAVGLPLSVVFLALAWLVLTQVVFRSKHGPLPGEDDLVRDKLAALGPMSHPERRVLVVFLLTASSWIALPTLWPGTPVTDEVVAIIAAVVLFLLPAGAVGGGRLLEWPDTSELPWGILLLFGGGLALASRITGSGLAAWVGQRAHSLADLPPILLVVVVVAITLAMTEFMSNTAAAATLLPIMGGVAIAVGVSPLLMTMPVALAAACTFMMPAATPPNAIAYSSGYVTVPQLVKAGAPLSASSLVLIPATVYLMGGLVFGLAF